MRPPPLALPCLLGFALGAAQALPPDVPADHWAAGAVEKAVALDAIGEAGQAFQGGNSVDRYEAARAVDRVLVSVGSTAAVMQQAAQVEAMGSDLEQTRGRLGAVEAEVDELRRHLDSTKAGRFEPPAERLGFHGLLSVGITSTDEGGPVGSTPFRTRYGGNPSKTFFHLPRSALVVQAAPAEDWRVHLHLDFTPDPVDRGLQPAGQNVGLNEAVLAWNPDGGRWTLRLGGFAPSFSSWEIDGPARTLTRTITPSVVNTFFDTIRLTGLEAVGEFEPGAHLRLALVNGADLGIGLQPPGLVGNISDAPGIGALGRSTSRDDRFGYYVDYERELGPSLKGRVGYLDLGGDTSARAPLVPTVDVTGFHVGLRGTWNDWEAVAQAVFLESDIGSLAGVRGDNDALSLGVTRHLGTRDSLTLRWDDWSNEVTTSPTSGSEGSAWTLAWARQLSDHDRLQWEWIDPDERFLNLAGADHEDEQFQVRYTVQF